MISSRAIAQATYELAQDSSNKKVAEHLVIYLERNNLLPLLGSIVEHLERITAEAGAQAELDIVSAHKLSDATVKEIKKSLGAEQLGSVTENKQLIGGFVAEYNGVVYDASVATQLNKLKNSLTS
jgi:F0F1-type ATP synthase delta subunit